MQERGQNTENRAGVPFSSADIERYLDHLARQNRTGGTLEWYRRGLSRLYLFLPDEDKTVSRDRLQKWQKQLIEEGYAPSTINEFLIVANRYLDYYDRREHQLIERLEKTDDLQPELSRKEYLRLLQAAKQLGKERSYLLVKLFGNTDLPVQSLHELTVETVRKGAFTVSGKGNSRDIRLPECLKKELEDYIDRQGILNGPVFLTRKGEPMNRSNINVSISQLCEAARVPAECATPRALRKMYRAMQESIEQNARAIAMQAQTHLLEQEQLIAGWKE